jgi:hypothetical protein
VITMPRFRRCHLRRAVELGCSPSRREARTITKVAHLTTWPQPPRDLYSTVDAVMFSDAAFASD